jgi:hypothetical protein
VRDTDRLAGPAPGDKTEAPACCKSQQAGARHHNNTKTQTNLAPNTSAWMRPILQQIIQDQFMDSVLQLIPQQRSELFIAAAQKSGIDAAVLEKDFWVCWTLKELFGLPMIGQNLIVKGGTSLSKLFKVINRLSEDIDLPIERGFLGYGNASKPEAGGSNKEKQCRVKRC